MKLTEQEINHIHQMYETNSFDKYCLLLGAGQHGKVYDYKGKYAIKVFSPNEEVKHLMNIDGINDAEYLSKLNHECFPKFYYAIDNKVIVMERVNGIHIDEYYSLHSTIDFDWKSQLLSGIKHCLNNYVFPDDITETTNIMVTNDKQLKIIDVGLFTSVINPYEDIDHMLSIFERVDCKELENNFIN